MKSGLLRLFWASILAACWWAILIAGLGYVLPGALKHWWGVFLAVFLALSLLILCYWALTVQESAPVAPLVGRQVFWIRKLSHVLFVVGVLMVAAVIILKRLVPS